MNILDQAYEYELYLNNLILRNNLEYIYPEIIEESDYEAFIEYSDDLFFSLVGTGPISSDIYVNYKGIELVSPSDKEIIKIWQEVM